MRSFIRYILPAIVLTWICSAQAIEVQTQTIELGHDQNIVFMPFIDNGSPEPMLLVIETPDLDEREVQMRGLADPDRTLSLYRQSEAGWVLHLQTKLDESMGIVDTVRSSRGIALAGYRNSQVHLLEQQTTTFEPLLTARSMYVGNSWDALSSVQMFQDVNGDELDDFLMPAFEGWQVALQSERGFDQPQIIGPEARMNFGDGMDAVGYSPETPHFFDADLDGLDDMAFWIDGRFEIYRQAPSGAFSEEALVLDPGMKDMLGSFLSVEIGDNDEELDQPQRLLEAVSDVDGDGLADLVVQTMEGDGIFGIETSYQIHRGLRTSDQQLSFEESPSSTLASDGIQIENERLDLTGDGQQEFVVTSVDITLGAIISALLTRSANVDVAIHQLDEGVFSGKPTLTKKIKVRFDFGEGDLFVPAVLSADVTGDGRQDLLVQRDEEMLLVYPGEGTERLFSKQPVRLNLDLPKDRENFVVADLDGDGRDELIVHLKQEARSTLSVIRFDA